MNPRNSVYALLRWSERYLKTDMVYLAKGGGWLTLGQIVSSGSAFVLAVAFANLLPAETYGTYRYVLSVAGFLSVATLPGMVAAVTRAVAKGSAGSVRAATRARLAWSALGALGAGGVATYYYLNSNDTLAASFAIVALILPFFDTYTLYGAYLTGKRDFRTLTLYHAITQTVSVIVVAACLWVTDNLFAILISYFIPLALMRFMWYRKTLSRIPDADDPETVRYGKHLSLMDILSTASMVVDKILLWKFLGPAPLAVYLFALAVPEQLKGPLKGVADMALPKFAEKNADEFRNSLPHLWRKLALYGAAIFVLMLGYAAAAPFIYGYFFPQYVESVFYSQLLGLSLVASVTFIPMSALIAQKKVRTQYQLTMVQPLIQIALFVLLIPPFGIAGAVGALIASRILSATWIILAAARALRSADV